MRGLDLGLVAQQDILSCGLRVASAVDVQRVGKLAHEAQAAASRDDMEEGNEGAVDAAVGRGEQDLPAEVGAEDLPICDNAAQRVVGPL
eukprot:932092-Alexandrium_andersonii.AAC.1